MELKNLEPEEYEELEWRVLTSKPNSGNLMNKDQLIDIVENLKKSKIGLFRKAT